MQREKQKRIRMNLKTAKIVSFILSTSALVIALVYLVSGNKDGMKPLMYVGLALVLGSLIFRNLIRFKPEWFDNKPTRDELERKKFENKK